MTKQVTVWCDQCGNKSKGYYLNECRQSKVRKGLVGKLEKQAEWESMPWRSGESLRGSAIFLTTLTYRKHKFSEEWSLRGAITIVRCVGHNNPQVKVKRLWLDHCAQSTMIKTLNTQLPIYSLFKALWIRCTATGRMFFEVFAWMRSMFGN